MTSFLVPVFFVLVGFRVDLRTLSEPGLLVAPLALTLAAVVGKLSCAAGVVNRGVSRLTVATGMIPRGEVAIVFAALGRTVGVAGAPLLDERGYTAIVTVVILTTVLTPVVLKWSLEKRSGASKITRPAA
jgi:Kef-type K+ transport system membrane component KefB